MSQVRGLLATTIAVDTRALAVLRVGLGALVLLDLLMRAPDLAVFYTDAGILPRSILLERSPWFHRLSLHTLSGAAWAVVLLFVLAAVAAVAMLLGYRTRAATVVSFGLLASLLARNPLVLNGGDSLLLLLLFWGTFLPLGARWSLDARFRSGPAQVASMASAALLVQVVLIYTVNAVFKARSGAWSDGEALQYVFRLDQVALPLAKALTAYPGLLSFLGSAWFFLVAASFLLILSWGRFRMLMVILFVGGHLGMLLTMRLGIFPLVSLAALLPFLPRPVWDQVERRVWVPLARRLPLEWSTSTVSTRPGGLWDRSLQPAIVSVVLVGALTWSGAGLGYIDVPEETEWLVKQHGRGWAMFAEPHRIEVWYVFPGQLEDGSEIDALHGAPVDRERPTEVRPYPDIRWRSYLSKLGEEELIREPFAKHLCRSQDGLVEVSIVRVERSMADGGVRERGLVGYSCPG